MNLTYCKYKLYIDLVLFLDLYYSQLPASSRDFVFHSSDSMILVAEICFVYREAYFFFQREYLWKLRQ